MIRLPRVTSMPFSARQLRWRSRSTSAGRPAPSLYSWVAGSSSAVAHRVDRRRRRPVVHHPLAERNRSRHLPDQVADHRHDRRLDPRPSVSSSTRFSGMVVSDRTAGLSLFMVCRSGPRLPDSPFPGCSAFSPLCRARRVRRLSRGRLAAVAGTVYRLQGRRRQQAGALGPDRRVHEARRRRIRPRPLPRARQDQRQQPVHRARDQRRPTR